MPKVTWKRRRGREQKQIDHLRVNAEEFRSNISKYFYAVTLSYMCFLFEIVEKNVNRPEKLKEDEVETRVKKFEEIRNELYTFSKMHRHFNTIKSFVIKRRGSVKCRFNIPEDFNSAENFIAYENFLKFCQKKKEYFKNFPFDGCHVDLAREDHTYSLYKFVKEAFKRNRYTKYLNGDDLEDLNGDIQDLPFLDSQSRNLNKKISYAQLVKKINRRRVEFEKNVVSPERMEEMSFKFDRTAVLDETDDVANMQCTVCLEDFAEGDFLCGTPCKHFYHRECLAGWLRGNSSGCDYVVLDKNNIVDITIL